MIIFNETSFTLSHYVAFCLNFISILFKFLSYFEFKLFQNLAFAAKVHLFAWISDDNFIK
jgi:hypothetical protein